MLTIRLSRYGKKNAPFFKIMAADSRASATKKYLEKVGYYKPDAEKPSWELNKDRFDFWVAKGATVSPRVISLVKKFTKKA